MKKRKEKLKRNIRDSSAIFFLFFLLLTKILIFPHKSANHKGCGIYSSRDRHNTHIGIYPYTYTYIQICMCVCVFETFRRVSLLPHSIFTVVMGGYALDVTLALRAKGFNEDSELEIGN